MEGLRRKIAELEHQNKMLEENYKSTSQGERQELLEKLAVAEVRANDCSAQVNLKDDEIVTLKKEIDSLRERLQTAYSEKDKQVEEIENKMFTMQSASEKDKQLGESYFKEELLRAQTANSKLGETVHELEREVEARKNEAITAETSWRQRLSEMEKSLSQYENEHRLSQGEFSKEMDDQKLEYERMLQEKEQQRQKQKNEWAEVRFFIKIN